MFINNKQLCVTSRNACMAVTFIEKDVKSKS